MLPANLGALSAGFDPDTTRLECQVSLTSDADQGWLLHRRQFRAAIYEVDLHDSTQDLDGLQKLMQRDYNPAQIAPSLPKDDGLSPHPKDGLGYKGYPGQIQHVHVRYCHVFYKNKS